MENLFALTKTYLIALSKSRFFNNSLVHAFCASWLIALGAHITVPFYPVPMTMQTFVIALVALLAPWPTAMGATVLYLGYAAVGMPVLAGGARGMAVLLGPTAGYLLGFVLMSGATAALTQRYQAQGVLARLGFALIGTLLLFGAGLTHLAHLFGWETAFKTGLLPFMLSEPTKLALAAYLSVFIRDKYLNKTK